MSARETWASRIGFVLAAVGSAVGLGNVWRFPYVTAENGGAAFLVVYLVAVVAIGLPAMLAEFVVGRGGHRNVVDVFGRIDHPAWRFVGVIGLATGAWIMAYYSVVGGWVLRYVAGSATGAYFGGPSAYFDAIASGPDAVALHFLFTALVVGVVAGGVQGGIELATKVMVPAIVLVMVALAGWAATLPGAGAGYDFYLDPEAGALLADLGSVLAAAVGQALFSLSVGMGVMVTYASYVGEDDDLAVDGLSIVALNTLVGVLAGLVVFPLLFAQGVPAGDPGPGAIFVGVATAFETLPAGRLLGLAFFAVVALAALSSAISVLEVVVSFAVDRTERRRPVLAVALGTATFLLGVPSALDLGVLSLFDRVASNVLLPLGATLVVAFVGWAYAWDAVAELRRGSPLLSRAGPVWLWHVRTLLLVAVAATLALGVATVAGVGP